MKNSDMPAMPLANSTTDFVNSNLSHANGLTKREHFAAMAIQTAGAEYISGIGIDYGPTEGWERHIAARAVSIADALLAALEADDE